MRRRQVRLRNEKLTDALERARAVRAKMREEFVGLSESDADELIKFFQRAGWTAEHLQSVSRQAGNTYRPSVQAFLFHNEHVLDQVLLNQGTYTNMRDSAEDPNFALRFTAESELLMRRITPGDLLMLRAAHNLARWDRDNQCPAEQNPAYWTQIWLELLPLLHVAEPQRGDMHLAAEAAVAAYQFAMSAPEDGEFEDIRVTFMEPGHRFYTGVIMSRPERVRSPTGFTSQITIERTEYGEESLYFFASVVVCHTIDQLARAHMIGLRDCGNFDWLFRSFLLRRSKPVVIWDGNQEAYQRPSGDGSDGARGQGDQRGPAPAPERDQT